MRELLTQRQLEVMQLAALGFSNKEIARRLWVQAATVKMHMSNASRQLGASNRMLAVRRAMELGLVELPVLLDAEVRACPHCGKAYV